MKLNVFQRFVLITFAGILVIMTSLGSIISRLLMTRYLELERQAVTSLVRAVTDVDLPADEFRRAVEEQQFDRFQSIQRHFLKAQHVLRVKIYDAKGVIVWSDEPRLIGRRFWNNEELEEALRGKIEVKVGLKKEEHRYEVELAPEEELLEVYVPLVSETGQVYGIIEVYKHAARFFQDLRSAKRLVWLSSFLGGLLLFASLSGVFWRAWKKEEELHQKLEEAKQFNEGIVENINVGVAVVDRDLTVLGWNRAWEKLCKRGSKSREEVMGRNLVQVFPELERLEIRRRLGHLFKTGSPQVLYGQDCPFCPSTDRTMVNISLIPIPYGTNVSRALILVEEISGLIEYQTKLIQWERLGTIGEIMAGFATEISNPLAIIGARVKLLLEEAGEKGLPEGLVRDLEVLDRHTFRIGETIHDLLTFARGPAHEFISLDVNEVITEAVGLIEKGYAERGIRIEKDLGKNLPPLDGSPCQLQLVFLNLFGNARDAMPEGGKIRVKSSLSQDGSSIVVEVADTGTGIPEAILGRIFEPFFTTKEVGKGTGLGLSVAFGVIKAHGGEIQVESKPGEGATFRVILPLDRRPGGLV